MKNSPVPVIMYHNVGIVNKSWIWGHLIYPWELFNDHLTWLNRLNFHTISLQELYNYKKNNTKLPSRSVVLTFDDGYLDNWVFVYPLLKKNGFKGTIFVNPEFVDTRSIVRKTLEDVWNNKETFENLETKGFLSWEEIKIMEAEGVMDIQSHSMSHTWFFCKDEIIDFHYPGNNKYPWLFWNKIPQRKSYYLMEDQASFVPYGTPIYRYGRSLGIKRYLEDENLTQYIVDFVKKQENNFFKERAWKSTLFCQIDLYKSKNEIGGRYETDEEQKRRFKYEIEESKKILENKLGKKINFLCWPGGAKTELSIKMCYEAGYLAYTCSADKDRGKNIFSEDPAKIYRIASAIMQRNGRVYYAGGLALIIQIFSFRGSFLAKVIKKMMKLFIILTIKLRIKKKTVHIYPIPSID